MYCSQQIIPYYLIYLGFYGYLALYSHEYDHGDSGQQNVEDQLDDALQKLDECIKEKTDLLEELHDTKHVLLECQQKLYEVQFSLYIFLSLCIQYNVKGPAILQIESTSCFIKV